ncbi:hypothetical protein C0992_012552 [Termitomyces sp. T32_za158]|nr:hypothetical protein C0992_012552 [Termitomyces sp. T32_za158]
MMKQVPATATPTIAPVLRANLERIVLIRYRWLVGCTYFEVEISLEGVKLEVGGTDEALDVEIMEIIVDDADDECTDELGILSDDSAEDEIRFVMRKGVGKVVVPGVGILMDVNNDDIEVEVDEINVSVDDGVILGVAAVDGDVANDVRDVSQESEESEVSVVGEFEDIDDIAVKMVVSGGADSGMLVDVEAQIQPDDDAVARNSDRGVNVYDGPQELKVLSGDPRL